MTTLFNMDKLAAYLDSEELEYARDDDEQTIMFPIEGDNGVFDVIFELNHEEGTLVCAVRPPLEFELEHLPRLYEAVARANHMLSLGGFQVNSEELLVLFVCGVPIEDADISHAQLQAVLGSSLECADAYTPAFENILEGAEAAAAIHKAEHPPEPPG